MASALRALHEAGASVWLDDLSRPLVEDGTLARLASEHGVSGVTCNPTIFARALSASDRYDGQLAELARRGVADPRELYLALALRDVELAADTLGDDGFVSFECTPDVAEDPAATIRQALQVHRRVRRPNLMVKVPGNDAGVVAIEELTAAGVNVNVTLLFSARRYEEAARAYARGLARRHDIPAVHSVASVFVSRVDGVVDRGLPDGHPLRGRAGIVNAWAVYDRWQRLDAPAAAQRPLWASTAPKDPSYPDVMYVDALAFAGTVVTLPPAILDAYADHGSGAAAVFDPRELERGLRDVAAAGVDLEAVGEELLAAGLASFGADYERALAEIESRLPSPRAA